MGQRSIRGMPSAMIADDFGLCSGAWTKAGIGSIFPMMVLLYFPLFDPKMSETESFIYEMLYRLREIVYIEPGRVPVILGGISLQHDYQFFHH